MSNEVIAIGGFVALFALMAVRVPIGIAMGIVGVGGFAAVVHPNQESHRLEAIAERFNVTVLGRHTALGDALVTAEIWLRLIPLLQAQGIHTLRQAREAAQKTYYARLKY